MNDGQDLNTVFIRLVRARIILKQEIRVEISRRAYAIWGKQKSRGKTAPARLNSTMCTIRINTVFLHFTADEHVIESVGPSFEQSSGD